MFGRRLCVSACSGQNAMSNRGQRSEFLQPLENVPLKSIRGPYSYSAVRPFGVCCQSLLRSVCVRGFAGRRLLDCLTPAGFRVG